MNLFLANGVLCLIGCGIGALLGFWARNGKHGRFLKALVVAALFSWTAWATGGGHGGAGIVPSVFLFYLVVIKNGFQVSVISQQGGFTEIFLTLVFMGVCSSLIFLSFWFFSRPKPLPVK